jgi:hypothetical protein
MHGTGVARGLCRRLSRWILLAVPPFCAFTSPLWAAQVECPNPEIVREQTLDRTFFDRLLAQTSPEERRRGVLEMLAARNAMDLKTVFAELGGVREDLRQVVRCEEAGAPVYQDLGDRAGELLALWDDPADKDLAEVQGATPAEACLAWTGVHFRAEGVPQPWTWHFCDEAVIDPAGTKALVKFRVRYAHWAYEQYLVLEREKEIWKLRRVVPGQIICQIRPG